MRKIAQLCEQESATLLDGELAQICEEPAQLGPPLDLLGKPDGGQLVPFDRLLAAGAKHGHAAVARNREQPRLERDFAVVVALEIAVGRRERVLHGVLGLLRRAEHVAAEGEYGRSIALEGHLKSRIVAAPDLLDQPLVAGQPEQASGPRRPRQGGSRGDRDCAHDQ